MADLLDLLKTKVIGQDEPLATIVPYIDVWQAGLSPADRPAGVFLLLGPTGTGKTSTVEALAAGLHGSPKAMVRIDCGEYQMEHEVAKLIGAPPGYLGHRETQPALTQSKLSAVTSDKCTLSVVLFDEIEKGSASIHRILLGIMDRGVLHLGDNTQVSFEKTVIFMTSNIGAKELKQIMVPWGLAPKQEALAAPAANVTLSAAKRRFAPEFMNRIDAVINYAPLTREAMTLIVDKQIIDLQHHIFTRLGSHAFALVFTRAAKEFLLEQGISEEYGARELKRVLQRQVAQPAAKMYVDGRLNKKDIVQVGVSSGQITLTPKLSPRLASFGLGTK